MIYEVMPSGPITHLGIASGISATLCPLCGPHLWLTRDVIEIIYNSDTMIVHQFVFKTTLNPVMRVAFLRLLQICWVFDNVLYRLLMVIAPSKAFNARPNGDKSLMFTYNRASIY